METGNIERDEMRRTFNCGVGMVVVVAAEDADRAMSILEESGEQAWRLGHAESGQGGVHYR